MSAGNQSAAALIYVEISDEPIVVGRPYADKTTGQLKPAISKQNAYLHSGARYPIPFKCIVPDVGPYRPGMYLVAGDVFKPGDFDGLKFFDRNLSLVAFADALKALGTLSPQGPKLAASA
jgi:hypothetical protein